MTGQEFDTLMQIVYSRWGAKAYPEVVKNRIWFFVRELPQKSFEHMIYTFLDSSRNAPMPQEFKMLAYAEKDKLGIGKVREPESKPSSEAKCWDCADSGNLFVIGARDEKRHAVMRCRCPIGSSRPQTQGAQWRDGVFPEWVKDPIYTKGLGNWKPTKDQGGMDMINFLISSPKKNERKGELENPFDDGPGAA